MKTNLKLTALFSIIFLIGILFPIALLVGIKNPELGIIEHSSLGVLGIFLYGFCIFSAAKESRKLKTSFRYLIRRGENRIHKNDWKKYWLFLVLTSFIVLAVFPLMIFLSPNKTVVESCFNLYGLITLILYAITLYFAMQVAIYQRLLEQVETEEDLDALTSLLKQLPLIRVTEINDGTKWRLIATLTVKGIDELILLAYYGGINVENKGGTKSFSNLSGAKKEFMKLYSEKMEEVKELIK